MTTEMQPEIKPQVPIGGPIPAGPVSTSFAPAPAESSVSEAIKQTTSTARDPLTSLLALVPVEKQAEASKHITDLLKEARDTGAPLSGKQSTLNIGRGNRYRRSERKPFGAKDEPTRTT